MTCSAALLDFRQVTAKYPELLHPTGAAKTLLKILDKAPEAALLVLG